MEEDRNKTELQDNPPDNDQELKMTLSGHLEELRRRIIKSLAFLSLSSIIAWYFTNPVIGFCKSFKGLENVKLILISPPEAFFVRVRLALTIGFLISLPFLLYQVLSFVMPGLKKNERKWVLALIPGSMVLFYGGAVFAVYLLLPIALNFFLVDMTGGIAEPQISLGEYVNFITAMLMAGGLVFQTPIILFFLTMIGVLSSEKLVKARSYAVVCAFIIAAVVTPPDPFSQIITAIPMIMLYELSIIAAKIAKR